MHRCGVARRVAAFKQQVKERHEQKAEFHPTRCVTPLPQCKITLMLDTKHCRWWCHCCFIHGIESPYPYSLCWLDCFADPKLARQLYASAFPLIDVTVMPDDEIMLHRRMALLELIQKHIRQRDLMGLVEQMACLLSSGYANDRQIKGLFNYILQTGDAVRFNDFIDGVAERSPKTQGEFNDYCGKIAAGRGTIQSLAYSQNNA